MAFSYDPATNVGKVRMLIPDRDPSEYVFDDTDIDAILEVEDGVVKLATALALETIASDQAMTLKVIRLMDLTTDGAKVSDALLKRAGTLRDQVAKAIATAEEDEGPEIVELVYNDFAYREKVLKELQRGT